MIFLKIYIFVDCFVFRGDWSFFLFFQPQLHEISSVFCLFFFFVNFFHFFPGGGGGGGGGFVFFFFFFLVFQYVWGLFFFGD